MEKKPEQKHHAWLFVGIILIICFMIYFIMQLKETASISPASSPTISPTPALAAQEISGPTMKTVLIEMEKKGFILTKDEAEDYYFLSMDHEPLSQAKITLSQSQGCVIAFTLEYDNWLMPDSTTGTAVAEELAQMQKEQQNYFKKTLFACINAIDSAQHFTYADQLAMYDTALEAIQSSKDLTYKAEHGTFMARLLSQDPTVYAFSLQCS